MPPFRFCPSCGASLAPLPSPAGRTPKQDCPACGAVHYKNPKPCAGALITRGSSVLLGRRAVDPFRDWWDIPGGFLEPWEHPAEAVVREVAEETGLRVAPTEILSIVMDRYGEGGDYTLNIFYLVEVIGGEERPGDDLVELRWFEAGMLPDRIAFDNGRKALAAWEAWIAARGRKGITLREV